MKYSIIYNFLAIFSLFHISDSLMCDELSSKSSVYWTFNVKWMCECIIQRVLRTNMMSDLPSSHTALMMNLDPQWWLTDYGWESLSAPSLSSSSSSSSQFLLAFVLFCFSFFSFFCAALILCKWNAGPVTEPLSWRLTITASCFLSAVHENQQAEWTLWADTLFPCDCDF